ncbi:MAG: sulfate/molybdate ABC transporter ATP-binding protein [Clostridia bacterium]|jgi:ABC-type sulfate/molybdate transport systems ATPase subunit|nr:sulfate/molybdate ABC transporter ATP-binding protein [Clostridia bacterium]
MEFYVDIIKKLPGFKLEIQLSSGQESIAILGASGSGKSMLLNSIAGLVRPDRGKVIINGKTLFDSEKKINLAPKDRKVGFLFQNYALFPHMTIAENITFALGALSAAEKNNRAAELLARFRLQGMEKRYPSQISGGQQQRVALARAFALEPEVLLLDEPFSALDNHLRNYMIKEMLESLKEFKGMTLFVTHNIEEAYRLSDRIAVLSAGSMEAFGAKDELFRKPPSLEAARITGCKNLAAAARVAEQTLEIEQWGRARLRLVETVAAETGFVGIRANHIRLKDETVRAQDNCFPAWIADESEAPFRTTLYLKIGSLPQRLDDFHLQWEISREQREKLKELPQPLQIYLDPEKTFFVNT